MTGDWTTCPECKGSGWADAVYEYTASDKRATGVPPVAGQPTVHHPVGKRVYVEPCNTCRGVKEIYLVGE
jgi:cytochrome c5